MHLTAYTDNKCQADLCCFASNQLINITLVAAFVLALIGVPTVGKATPH